MKILYTAAMISFFVAGLFIGTVQSGDIYVSESIVAIADNAVHQAVPFGGNDELASPFDRVRDDQVLVYDDYVILDIQNTEWAIFTDTNSMDPVIDQGAAAIEIIPLSADELHVGDIVSYKSEFAEGIIIHRVVEIGEDDDGWYARFKGDNNANIDPGKVRFDQVQRIVIAIIY